MASFNHLSRFCHCVFLVILNLLFVVVEQTLSVKLGPTGKFKDFSDVIFPGELFQLECIGYNTSNCEIFLYLNNEIIYGNGTQLSEDYVITGRGLPCSLNITVTHVTGRHNGTYKCRIHNDSTTTEDTYELNLVTESPYCLAKCVESGNSFQLFCYISSPVDDPPVFMTWEIIEPGSDPRTFVNFTLTRLIGMSIVKTVGVSHGDYSKEECY